MRDHHRPVSVAHVRRKELEHRRESAREVVASRPRVIHTGVRESAW